MGSFRAAFTFDGALQRSMHRFKYRGEHARGKFLAELLIEYAWDIAPDPRACWDSLIPIALYPRRRRARGFNQAEILGDVVGHGLALPVQKDGLMRTRNTRPQVGLPLVERRRNVAGAFGWVGAPLAGARVLLIDDVLTTGSTMIAAAEVILDAGASRVDGLALARQG